MGSRRRRVADVVVVPAVPDVHPVAPAGRGRHRDFIEKVAGTLRYADDWALPGMLHGVLVRAPGAVRDDRIDRHRPMRAPPPACAAVLTAADIPHNVVVEDASGLGIDPIVQPVLASDRVRYAGEPVAVVAAESRGGRARCGRTWSSSTTASRPGVFTLEDALAPARRAVHAGRQYATCSWQLAVGDAEAALAARGCGRRWHLPQPARRPRLPGARGRHRLDRQRRRAHAARLHAGDRARPPDRRDPRSCPRAACA